MDIVERLRAPITSQPLDEGALRLCRDAADEIERLRNMLNAEHQGVSIDG